MASVPKLWERSEVPRGPAQREWPESGSGLPSDRYKETRRAGGSTMQTQCQPEMTLLGNKTPACLPAQGGRANTSRQTDSLDCLGFLSHRSLRALHGLLAKILRSLCHASIQHICPVHFFWGASSPDLQHSVCLCLDQTHRKCA